MRVGATRTKGTDPRHTRALSTVWPRNSLLRNLETGFREIEMWVQLGRVERRGDGVMLELKDHLGQRRDTRRRLCMADGRLDRPYPDRCRRSRRKRILETNDLDRVTKRRACTVRLDVANAGSVHPRASQGLSDDVALRGRAWNRETIRPSCCIQGRALDDRMDVIAVS